MNIIHIFAALNTTQDDSTNTLQAMRMYFRTLHYIGFPQIFTLYNLSESNSVVYDYMNVVAKLIQRQIYSKRANRASSPKNGGVAAAMRIWLSYPEIKQITVINAPPHPLLRLI